MRRVRTRRWLAGHRADAGVRAAVAAGWRSRAALKLIELDRRHGLLGAGRRVLDLGAAPGGWSQVAVKRGCRVVAVDLLPVAPLPGAALVQGDFAEPAVRAEIARLLRGRADAVLCDAAPSLAGIRATDDAACLRLHDAALECALALGAEGCALAVKTFAGEPQEHLQRRVRELFGRSAVRKPATSRSSSAEAYVVAHGLGGHYLT